MKAAAIEILRLDDEGNEHSETITVGDVSEHGRWTQTVKEITIGEDCLLDVDGVCKECVWDAVGKDEEKLEKLDAALRHCLREAANAVELLEAESNDDFYNPKETLNKLNELVVYIAGQLNPRE